ncbi:MAG: tetratricopeptide repeat protein [Aridibacter famidurans]|nr:tetratricopeptide repeat protein [Aridibacter famidurans]
MLKGKVKIKLLGGLSARVDDRMITKFRTYKTGVLLAFLSYHHDRRHPREELIEMLWDECEPVLGRNSLSQSLSSLRRQLEPPGVESGTVLVADRYNVGVNSEAVETDADRFSRALEEFADSEGEADRAKAFAALRSEYTGEFLPGFYEDWCLRERDRLKMVYLDALRERTEQLVETGQEIAAVEILKEAVQEDPLDEDLQFSLIRLYGDIGRRAKALSQFAELTDVLEEELGVEPPDEISAYVESIRSGEAAGPDETEPKEKKTRSRFVSAGSTDSTAGLVALLAVEDRESKIGDLITKESRDPKFRIRTEGNTSSLFFSGAGEALDFAIELQRMIDKKASGSNRQSLPRMALTIGDLAAGAATPGLVSRTKALLGSAHPGQFVCGEAAASLLVIATEPRIRFRELGIFRLGTDGAHEKIFQVDHSARESASFDKLNAEEVESGRLPVRLSRFFGREREINTLCEWLDPERCATRLVTLTGPGGTGKTRLSLEVGSNLQSQFGNRVYFVPLATTLRPDLIASAILEAAGEPTSSGSDPLGQIGKVFREKRTLLILDNLEHLLLADKASEANITRNTIEEILKILPEVWILATSRNDLNVFGEREFFVEPLPVPAEGFSADQVRESESVRLFVDRAQSVRPTFQLVDSSLDLAGRICSRLEGIPLAIELAAAQIQVLTLSRIEEGLSRRLDFLADKKRQPERRHQRLRETIDWSFRLLPEDVREFFCALSVFRGGGDVSDAELVVEDPLALDHLAFLEEASFLRIDENEASGDMRFSMLETLREYGREKLDDDSLLALRNAHANRYLALAENASPKLKGEEQSAWLKRLETDQSNLRAALDHFIRKEDAVSAAKMATALETFWQTLGLASEGVGYLNQVLDISKGQSLPSDLVHRIELALGDLLIEVSDFEGAEGHFERARVIADENADPKGLAEAFNGIGRAVFERGDYARAYPYQERSLELWKRIGDDYGTAVSLNNLGLIACERGDYPRALSHYNESLGIRRKIADKKGIATQLNNIGIVCRRTGDYEGARSAYEESLALREELGDIRNVASSLSNLSWVAENVLDFERSEALQHKALKIREEIGDDWGIALSKNVLAILARHQGELKGAREMFEESLSIRRRIGNQLGIGETLFYLGDLLVEMGELKSARDLLREALEVTTSTGNRLGIACALEACSRLALAEGQAERSTQLLFASLNLRNEIGASLTPSEQRVVNEQEKSIRDAIDGTAFRDAKQAGLTFSLEEARKLAETG